jgi:hypothetical protein
MAMSVGVEVSVWSDFCLQTLTITFSFAGKSVCLGSRLAKVELKLILSLFVLGYDLNIVDKDGKPSETLPEPNWNDILLCRPPKGSFYVGFSRKDNTLL